jgi:hypothetical protein
MRLVLKLENQFPQHRIICISEGISSPETSSFPASTESSSAGFSKFRITSPSGTRVHYVSHCISSDIRNSITVKEPVDSKPRSCPSGYPRQPVLRRGDNHIQSRRWYGSCTQHYRYNHQASEVMRTVTDSFKRPTRCTRKQ